MAVRKFTLCTIAGCGKPHYARGWCSMHYARGRKHGDPLIVLPGGRPFATRLRPPCSVVGCERPVRVLSRGLCMMHYCRWQSSGDPLQVKFVRGAGSIIEAGYRVIRNAGKAQREHIVVAEQALGKPLPPGAIVHHVDENKLHNANSNLVICPDRTYHSLLHARMRALAACGDPAARPCMFCHLYDAVGNLEKRTAGSYSYQHRACWNRYRRERWRMMKACSAPSCVTPSAR